MALDQQGNVYPRCSSAMVSCPRAPLGKCVKSCSFQSWFFFSLIPRTHWFELQFVHVVTSGDIRGLYLYPALSVKGEE